ncbi:TraR/DksA C4-type zinc finger protein [Candidatus Woesebacteria bacterium]|jgi:RNA polymerase-binding transcription factor DksA|nr:TraR/DksA C4-type zinc finger protein [Candidatus Woesebacteria bacterium]
MAQEKTTPPVFPKSVLTPVTTFLKDQLSRLTFQRKQIQKEDPFRDLDRITDTIAPDAEAAEQMGHAQSSAISRELSRKIIQTKRALARIKIGKYGTCTECGNMIDTDRLMVFPEATLCVMCEKKRERRVATA